MNQILREGSNLRGMAPRYGIDPKGTNKLAINKSVKMFASIILIFGIAMISMGVYGKITEKPKQIDQQLEIRETKQGSKVTLKIKSGKPVRLVSYKWNEGESTAIQGNNKLNIEQIITIPQGNNILKITVTDYYGNERDYQKQYIKKSNDSQNPEIAIIQDETDKRKIKITVKDDTQLTYMTYEWDKYREISTNGSSTQNLEIISKGKQEKIVFEKGKKEHTFSLDIPAGNNILIIEVADGEENVETIKKAIKGLLVPEVELSTKNGILNIKATDEIGVSKVEVNVDGAISNTGDTPLNLKEVNTSIEVGKTKHKIIVTVINMQGQQKVKEIETGA
jgi:hypothetical protein